MNQEEEADRILLRISQTLNEDNNFIPKYCNGEKQNHIRIYRNGQLLFRNINFKFLIPEVTDTTDKDFSFQLGFIPEFGDIIEIYFLEERKPQYPLLKKLVSEIGMVNTNIIPYPFYLDYMDLYINNKKINPENIEYISDIMIKLKNINRIYNVGVVLKKEIPQELSEFFPYLELEFSKWEEWLNSIFGDNGEFDLDDFYNDVVLHNNPELIEEEKIINLEEDNQAVILRLLLNILGRRFGFIPYYKKIDFNIIQLIFGIDVLSFVISTLEDNAIPLSANEINLQNSPYVFDANDMIIRTDSDMLNSLKEDYKNDILPLVIDFNSDITEIPDEMYCRKYMYDEEIDFTLNANVNIRDEYLVIDANILRE